MADVIVVGAGVAGLSAAACLAADGADVLVLERHNVPGGCASFYQRARFRFDVGATLVGGFGDRGIHARMDAWLGLGLEPVRVEPAMVVHLPDASVERYSDARWMPERRRVFGLGAEPFWERLERIAERAWEFAAGLPMLPADPRGFAALLAAMRPRHRVLAGTVGRRVADVLPSDAGPRLRAFVDAQLLITAQAGAEADLAYGATALDLAREGTFHLAGGIGAIATSLARAVRTRGGRIAYKTSAVALETGRAGRIAAVRSADGRRFEARTVVAALPVQNVAALLADPPAALRGAAARPARWGAFMLYVALPAGVVPDALPLHHQLVRAYGEPPGEGATAFLSFSAPGERGRAPDGGRTVTISTHTDVARWERALADGREAALRAALADALRAALERVVPGAGERALFVETATPATFARYTGRARGLVGGLPQLPGNAGLFALSHRSGVPGLVLAGDTVFPGQSTVGASLGGIAAARAAGAVIPASLRAAPETYRAS